MSGARTPTRDFGPAIERLRGIADRSGDALLSEGSVHPDHRLLALCAEAAELHQAAKVASQDYAEGWTLDGPPGLPPAAFPRNVELREKNQAADRALSRCLRAASKIPATTPAGIYAKAIAVMASKTGAAVLAMSLAEDLTHNPVLRAALWSAGKGDGL